MAHAGGVKPCVSMQVIDNELVIGSPTQTTVAVSDIDLIVQRLACGEVVYCQLYGDLVHRVTRTVQMMLGGR